MIDRQDNLDSAGDRTARTGWGVPLAIAAIALVAGILLFNWSSDRTTTASSTAPGTTQSTPAPQTPPPTRPGTGG